MNGIKLHFLGTFQAQNPDGIPIAFRSVTERAMLAYLVIEQGRPHSRDRVCTLLWPEAPADQARNNLRVALHRLRKAVEVPPENPALILTEGDDLQINSVTNLWVDAWLFRQTIDQISSHDHVRLSACATCMAALEDAVALYRGEFLEGVALENNQPFSEWVLIHQEWFQRQAILGLFTLAEHALLKGDLKRAETYARQQIRMEPWREEAHRQLMIVYARQGERTAAIAQFKTCQKILDTELSLPPSKETVNLYEQISSGDFKVVNHPVSMPALAESGNQSNGARAEGGRWAFSLSPWQALFGAAAVLLLLVVAFYRPLLGSQNVTSQIVEQGIQEAFSTSFDVLEPESIFNGEDWIDVEVSHLARCSFTLGAGILTITDSLEPGPSGCTLSPRDHQYLWGEQLGTLSVRMKLLAGGTAFGAGTYLGLVTTFENGVWRADCGLNTELPSPVIVFAVADSRRGGSDANQLLFNAVWPVERETWVELILQIDPDSQEVSYRINGNLIGRDNCLIAFRQWFLYTKTKRFKLAKQNHDWP